MTIRGWSLLPLSSAVATAAVLALLPVWTTSSCATSSAGGSMSCSSSSRSLLAAEGASVLVVLAVPALITLVPLAFPSRGSRAAVAGLLTLVMLISVASVGLFLVPTVLLAWIAVAAARHPAGTRPGRSSRAEPRPLPADPSPRRPGRLDGGARQPAR